MVNISQNQSSGQAPVQRRTTTKPSQLLCSAFSAVQDAKQNLVGIFAGSTEFNRLVFLLHHTDHTYRTHSSSVSSHLVIVRRSHKGDLD